ncbi:MAG TPA: HAD family hydrolase [Acidobacteriaceae bacterium]|nr:HAD family hydrolase [Acidobacteriaceae bacterium]
MSAQSSTTTMQPKGRALFLDRDGVVNEEIGYLSRADQVRFVAGIFDLCRRAQALGYCLIVVTNQAGIARGFYTEEDFHALTHWMEAEFAREGVRLDRTYFCPHHPEHGVGQYRRDCPDRKPNPGMLLHAAREFQLDLAQSIFIGDRCTDMAAGEAAGVGTLLLLDGMESGPCVQAKSYRRMVSLKEAIEVLAK